MRMAAKPPGVRCDSTAPQTVRRRDVRIGRQTRGSRSRSVIFGPDLKIVCCPFYLLFLCSLLPPDRPLAQALSSGSCTMILSAPKA